MMHFPLFPTLSDCPLFPKKCLTPWKISQLFLFFREKFSDFYPPKFLMTFSFSHQPQISNVPLFPLFQYISPYFDKIILSPTFINRQIYVFFTYFMCFSFPLLLPWCIYASHNARTGRL